jgi:hypothetical protein
MGKITREDLENIADDIPEEEIDDVPPEEIEEPVNTAPRRRPSSKTRRRPVEEPEEEPVEFEEDDFSDAIDDDYDDGWDDTDPTTYNLEDVFKRYWRPIAAYVYLAICLFDFIAMPIFKEMQRDSVNMQAFAEVMKIQDKDVQLKALEQLELNKLEWHPITLEGGGLFHISFGAILGVAAWTRGAEKRAAIEFRGATRTGLGRPTRMGGYGPPPRRRY